MQKNAHSCRHLFISIYSFFLFFRSRAHLIAAATAASQTTRRIAHFVQATMRTIARSENKAGHSLRHFFALTLTLFSLSLKLKAEENLVRQPQVKINADNSTLFVSGAFSSEFSITSFHP